MQQNRLEDYLSELENGLRSLPPSERERELTETRQHLESLIAAHRQTGLGNDAATEAAIHQFGSARENGMRLRQAERRGRLKNLPPLAVVALYALAASTLFEYSLALVTGLTIFGINVLKGLWIPQHAIEGSVTIGPIIPFSHVLGLAALVFLFAQQGIAGTFRHGLYRKTGVGTTVSYTLADHFLGSTLFLGIYFLNMLGIKTGVVLPVWWNAISVLSVLLGGWYAGLRSETEPIDTVKTVSFVALFNILLGFLNLLGNISPFAVGHMHFAAPSAALYLSMPLAALAAYAGTKMRRGSNTVAAN